MLFPVYVAETEEPGNTDIQLPSAPALPYNQTTYTIKYVRPLSTGTGLVIPLLLT